MTAPKRAQASHGGVSLWLKTHTVLLALNVLLVAAIIAALGRGYHSISMQLDDYNDAASVLSSSTPEPRVVANVANFLSEATGTFMFGSSTGSAPVFVQNSIMNYDFNAMATAIKNLANAVRPAMAGASKKDCYMPMQCPPDPRWNGRGGYYYLCPNGESRYCQNENTVVDCSPVECIGPEVAKVSSIVESAAGVLATMTKVNDMASGGNAAFSAGLFRIDTLLDWVKSQTAAAEWKSAAGACIKFLDGADGITWTGEYTKDDGTTQSWDIHEDVKEIMRFAKEVCTPLSEMATN